MPRVEKERMFGFQALWAEGRIFALVVSESFHDDPDELRRWAQRA